MQSVPLQSVPWLHLMIFASLNCFFFYPMCTGYVISGVGWTSRDSCQHIFLSPRSNVCVFDPRRMAARKTKTMMLIESLTLGTHLKISNFCVAPQTEDAGRRGVLTCLLYSTNRVYDVGVLTVLVKGPCQVGQPVRAAGEQNSLCFTGLNQPDPQKHLVKLRF